MKNYSPDELLKMGIIDEEKYNLLKNKSLDKKETKLSLNLFFNILAGLLLGLGIIWVIAANWGLIPDYLIMAVLLLGTVGSMTWTIIWKNKSKNLEIPSIIYAAFSIGTIAYIGQYFNVAANTELFLLVCLWIIASISFYTKSFVLSNAYLILGAIYFVFVPNVLSEAFGISPIIGNYSYSFWMTLFNPIIYAIIPLCYKKFALKDEYIKDAKEAETKLLNKISHKIKTRYSIIFRDTFLIVASIAILNGVDSIGEIALYGILLLAITSKSPRWEFNALKWIAIAVTLFVSCSGLDTYSSFGEAIFIIAPAVIYHVTKVKLNIFKKIKEYKTDKENKLLSNETHKGIELLIIFTGLFIMFLDNIFDMIWDKNFYWQIYLVFVLGWSIYEIVDGIKNSRSVEFTFGEVLLTFEIFRFVFAFEDDLMFRGISAIIIAAVILFFNKKASKKIKAQASKEVNNE